MALGGGSDGGSGRGSGGDNPAGRDQGQAWAGGGAHLATVLRGGEVDSVHFGAACLVDADGKVLWSLGDPALRAFFRSSAKPIQAQAVLDTGAHRAFGFDDADLAILCGSHAGGPDQVRQVRGLLAKCGLDESRLGCGDGPADQCSGKHAGMLAACKHRGLPLEGYLEPEHPWQRAVLETVAGRCGLSAEDITLALDGCSAPTFGMPLYNMALGFARMGREARISGASADGPARLFQSMLSWPAHTGEPDMRVYRAIAPPRIPAADGISRTAADTVQDPDSPGDVPVTKGGAHGLHCAAFPALGLGFALKVADGSASVRWPIFIGALEKAGLVGSATSARMREALWPRILTRRDQPAGEIRLAF